MKKLIKTFLKKIKDGSSLPCYIISREPLVLISFWHDLYTNASAVFKAIPEGRKVYFILQLGWHRETEERVLEMKEKVEELKELRPDSNYTFLCNSKAEETILLKHGLNGILCHQNAFVDTDYFPLLDCPKEFDAVYTARITPFKNHQLAAEIKSLRLIGDYHEHERKYVDETFSVLQHADWSRRIHFSSMYKELSRARVGLCLSSEEGAMFASIEYLLCGLPVVSTPNLGGRDFFFDKDFSAKVEPSPSAVAEGVYALIEKNIDPVYIREKTLKKMQEQREIFIGIIQEIFDKEGSHRNFKDEWNDVFIHKFAIRTSMPWFGRAKRGRLTPGKL